MAIATNTPMLLLTGFAFYLNIIFKQDNFFTGEGNIMDTGFIFSTNSSTSRTALIQPYVRVFLLYYHYISLSQMSMNMTVWHIQMSGFCRVCHVFPVYLVCKPCLVLPCPAMSCLDVIKDYYLSLRPRLRVLVPPSCVHRDNRRESVARWRHFVCFTNHNVHLLAPCLSHYSCYPSVQALSSCCLWHFVLLCKCATLHMFCFCYCCAVSCCFVS